MSATDALLDGAVDLHVHPAPSPFPRRLTVSEAAMEAAESGFAAIAVKSHHHSMTTDVLAVESAMGKLPLAVLSGVCLNNDVGGLNPYAVETTLNLGGRIIWLPTLAARQHLAAAPTLHTFPTSVVPQRPQAPVDVLDHEGELRPEALDILSLVAGADAILSCGHLGCAEIDVVIASAQRLGVRRIMVNHPNFIVGADPAQCARWAEHGVYVEHSLCHYIQGSAFRKYSLDTLMEYVARVGADHTILSSDLGQVGNPTPVEGFHAIVDMLLDRGVAAAVIRRLVSGSAHALIG